MKNTNNTIVAFHIGRGGRFNNQGFLTFLDEKPIGHYVGDLFRNFENLSEFSQRCGFDQTNDRAQKCITDLVTDRKFEELEEKFGITKEMLGEEIYIDLSGTPVGLTVAEEKTGIGCIDQDGDYDTTYTKYLEDITEKEAEAILSARGYVSYEIKYFAKECLGIEDQVGEED